MPPATSLRFLAAAIVTLCCALASSQNASCGVQLSSSQPVVYPAIARAAHVSGTVTVLTRFNRDGSVASANVLNGPEMLRIATLTFLRTARTGVSEGSRECPILVAYQLVNNSEMIARLCPTRKPSGNRNLIHNTLRSPRLL